jgi:hypothetical protein
MDSPWYERIVPVAARGLGDQRKPIAPVVTVADEQANALAIALDDQPIAVVLDFVDPPHTNNRSSISKTRASVASSTRLPFGTKQDRCRWNWQPFGDIQCGR